MMTRMMLMMTVSDQNNDYDATWSIIITMMTRMTLSRNVYNNYDDNSIDDVYDDPNYHCCRCQKCLQ